MADEQVIASGDAGNTKLRIIPAGADDHSVVEWLEDEIYQALEPLKVAMNRMWNYHQNDTDVIDDIMVLERLLENATARLRNYDAGVSKHFGPVGVYRVKRGHPEHEAGNIVGVRILPKEPTSPVDTASASQ